MKNILYLQAFIGTIGMITWFLVGYALAKNKYKKRGKHDVCEAEIKQLSAQLAEANDKLKQVRGGLRDFPISEFNLNKAMLEANKLHEPFKTQELLKLYRQHILNDLANRLGTGGGK